MNNCAFSFYYKQKETKYVIGIIVVLQQTFVFINLINHFTGDWQWETMFYPYLSQGKH